MDIAHPQAEAILIRDGRIAALGTSADMRALAAGGTELHPPEDLGFMYSCAFADPDGNGWGPMWFDTAAAG